MLGAALAALLAGCIVEPARPVYVAPAAAGTVVAADDYIYYPDYEVYYNQTTGVYWYMQGGVWMTGPVVPGIAMGVLVAAPSIRMDFHDSPANHHAMVIGRYPRGWRPPR